MSACFDVYTLPASCSVVWTYPSAAHPPIPPSPIPDGGMGTRPQGNPIVIPRDWDDEETTLAVLGLFGPDL